MINETAVTEAADRAIEMGSGMAFIYQKANGDVEERRIVPLKTETTKDGNVIIRSFDRDRNALRSWRVDRVFSDSIAYFDPKEMNPEEDINETLLS